MKKRNKLDRAEALPSEWPWGLRVRRHVRTIILKARSLCGLSRAVASSVDSLSRN